MPFVVVWGGVLMFSLMCWTAFVMAAYALFDNRYTTYAAGLTALLLSARHLQHSSMDWVYNWTMLRTLRWSDMALLDLNARAVFYNRMLVALVAGVLIIAAVRWFPRTRPDPARVLDRLRPKSWPRAALAYLPVAVPAAVVAMYLTVQIRSGFQSKSAVEAARSYWRQNVETWSDVPPPTIRHVELAVDLDPASRGLSVSGEYLLHNPTDQAMSRIPFTVRPALGTVAWDLAGAAVPVENRSGLHVLTLDSPLVPGDSVEVAFSYSTEYPRGFTRNGGGVSQFVLPSGVLLHTLRNSFLPTPGFVEGVGLSPEDHAEPASEPAVRRPVREPRPRPYTTRVQVTAPSAYTVNGPGVKTEEHTADGVTTVVWESRHPVGSVSLVGGRWRSKSRGDVQVFYHPEHDYNVDRMLEALSAARARYAEWFHPYPWGGLRVNEYPNHNTNAMGFPTNIPFSEGLGFLSRSGSLVHSAFVVTAHEAAHQWWGNLLSAGDGPGADHLVEGLAAYSALLLQEAENGSAARVALARKMEQDYTRMRRNDTEVPLSHMVDRGTAADRTVIYDKGAWVQWMLTDLMGREAMLSGLRAFIQASIDSGVRPELVDMLEALRPFAPDPVRYDAFVGQWFYDVVLPEFRLSQLDVQASAGGWAVSVTVENVGTGTVAVELAALAGQAREVMTVDIAPGRPVRVRFELDTLPGQVVVDPGLRLLQNNRDAALLELVTPS